MIINVALKFSYMWKKQIKGNMDKNSWGLALNFVCGIP